MQTHFDRGFGAGLDLPTEKKTEKYTKSTPPPKKNEANNNNPKSAHRGGEERTFTGWAT
jgi:hypothetical protein